MNAIFAVWPFRLGLEKRENKEKHKIFLGTNVFRRYTVTTRASSDQSSYEPAARGTVFNFPAATRNRKNRKYQINSAQVSYKLARKLFLTVKWNISAQWLQTYNCLVYKRCSVDLSKENRGRRVKLSFTKIKLFRLVKCKEIKTNIHHFYLVLLYLRRQKNMQMARSDITRNT